jgi:hypothetical protein
MPAGLIECFERWLANDRKLIDGGNAAGTQNLQP